METKEKAELAHSFFTVGVKNRIITKDDSPKWVSDLCHAGHDSALVGLMFPDDWRYKFIDMALEAIAGYDDIEDARCELEPSIYNYELTDWLGSRNDRYAFCDEYTSEFGGPGMIGSDNYGIMANIRSGQMMEIWEVFDAVVSFLDELDLENEEVA